MRDHPKNAKSPRGREAQRGPKPTLSPEDTSRTPRQLPGVLALLAQAQERARLAHEAGLFRQAREAQHRANQLRRLSKVAA